MFAQFSFNAHDLTLGALTLRNANVVGRGYIDIPPLQYAVFDVDGATVANMMVGDGDFATLTFSTPIHAFGADFAALNTPLQNARIEILGQSFASTPAGLQFLGFVSDTAFATVRIMSDGRTGFGMDNLGWGVTPPPAPDVPLPESLLLLGGALGGAALMRRRRAG